MKSVRRGGHLLLLVPAFVTLQVVVAKTNATTPAGLTKFGTWPYSDAVFEGPQVIPGTVRLAYYDKGGMDKAYHSYQDHNFGSCDLNPCDGQYKNLFRRDEGGSTSYTKPPNGDWPGDTFAANGSHVPVDDLYWGWLALGSWTRTSVLLKSSGTLTATMFGTCNSGGTLNVRLDYNDDDSRKQVEVASEVEAHVASTGHYHKWGVWQQLFAITAPRPGPAVLTVNVTGVDPGPTAGQFGNIMWLSFEVLDRPR